jgi:multiple sugar transport system ATP-binding protein
MADVAFNEVNKFYENGFHAVSDLSLDIKDGEFLVLVGPSGCGKTTALRMVAGLEEISGGELFIGERIVNKLTPKERDVAMVFQNYALYPHLSVYENIAFGLRLRKESKAVVHERVTWAAKMLDLTPYLDRKPKQLSGGQRQRVAMGRAIVREPDAFLMDEPLSNLDAKLRVEMRSYLATLHQQLRTTTLYVTHDQTEAMTMGDRVAVMRDGRLQQVDRPQVLYERPVNLFVAGFIGSPAMNLLRARLTDEGDTLSLELGGTTLNLPSAVLAERPRLADYRGADVILGIRPEDIEDAALMPSANGRRLDVRVTLAEALGAEVIAHFPLAARSASGAASLVAARGSDSPLLEAVAEGDAVLTARLSPRTAARSGAQLGVYVHVERAHFFDPESEEAIW